MYCLRGESQDDLQKLHPKKFDFSCQVNPSLNGHTITSQIKFKERVAKTASITCSFLLVVCYSTLLLFCVSTYIHWKSRTLVLSLQEIITCHVVFVVLMIVSIIAAVLGSMKLKVMIFVTPVSDSVRLIKKKVAFVTTCQIFGLFVLLAVKGGVLFGILVQWDNNLETGISFAVQGYNPILHLAKSIDGIQIGLNCCGRGSPNDYKISNEFFVPGYVPTSCCNTKRFYSTFCSRMLLDSKLGLIYEKALEEFIIREGINNRNSVARPNQTIPYGYAYQIGCYTKMHSFVRPTIAIIFSLLMLLDVCAIASAFAYILLSRALSLSMKQNKHAYKSNT